MPIWWECHEFVSLLQYRHPSLCLKRVFEHLPNITERDANVPINLAPLTPSPTFSALAFRPTTISSAYTTPPMLAHPSAISFLFASVCSHCLRRLIGPSSSTRKQRMGVVGRLHWRGAPDVPELRAVNHRGGMRRGVRCQSSDRKGGACGSAEILHNFF
ncbi:hypothetical protein OG21DRAFT_1169137 [Imleria badia]|nr:hypothetical protein OG21DRAFT_1169137 [Imleria badia]